MHQGIIIPSSFDTKYDHIYKESKHRRNPTEPHVPKKRRNFKKKKRKRKAKNKTEKRELTTHNFY